jgi:Phage terminase large subunit (GpA)/Pretoxin HINT domain
MALNDSKQEQNKLFSQLKTTFLDYDPAHFIQNNLTLDGEPFRIIGNGWKFMADVYRYVALQASKKNGKPVVIKKGRQVGATMMAGALDIYFTNSGLFVNPPIRVAHLFPAIAQVKRFTQDKLENLIRSTKDDLVNKNKLNTSNAVDNLTMKQFNTGTLWVESIGADADRVRGMTLDVAFFDECFPYDQYIEVEFGKIKIGKLYEDFKLGKPLPRVKSFSEELRTFQYKTISNAWKRDPKDLVKIKIGQEEIKCTPNHKFLTSDGWIEAKNLNQNHLLISSAGLGSIEVAYYKIDYVELVDEKEVVYDIEVSDNHNFILSPSSESHFGGPVVHNCQDMMGLAIGNATKTLTAAKYGPVGKGVQVYFGTPKEKGSWFELTWEMSDQRYYHLGCKNCQKTFPFYQPNDDGWKKVWISGFDIKCPICGFIQHKIDAIERGKWVPSRNEEEAKYVGFHINQLYIPYLNREYINSLMPENNPNQSERVWNNEVVGEFYASVGMPLTRAHIEAYCKDVDRTFAKKIDAKERPTYLGIDWGDKTEQDSRGQSYSCSVIISDIGDGTLQIEHAHILKERTFQYKKATVNELYKRFSVKRGVSDFFFGQDVVRELQVADGLGDRFIGAQGSGALTSPIKYREDELMISYNKDLMIEEIFDKMKKGKIRFPWKSYEYVEWLIDHCTSMGVAIRNRGGQEIKTYVKGSTPNDGLMALMYAYMAWKFDSTQGFTIKPGTKELSAMPKPSLAFVPRLRR